MIKMQTFVLSFFLLRALAKENSAKDVLNCFLPATCCKSHLVTRNPHPLPLSVFWARPRSSRPSSKESLDLIPRAFGASYSVLQYCLATLELEFTGDCCWLPIAAAPRSSCWEAASYQLKLPEESWCAGTIFPSQGPQIIPSQGLTESKSHCTLFSGTGLPRHTRGQFL